MIIYDYVACSGCQDCLKVCPRGVWGFNETAKKAELLMAKKCIDCTSCEFQCPVRAIRIERSMIPKRPRIVGKPD
ncbi:MAG: 4Fe-4S dicluster domain-containing protein [Candidatus Thorarchaeota archaeon]|jgi:NAD-dependent dihydropyrimidine dehydrogenase PreA subunit